VSDVAFRMTSFLLLFFVIISATLSSVIPNFKAEGWYFKTTILQRKNLNRCCRLNVEAENKVVHLIYIYI